MKNRTTRIVAAFVLLLCFTTGQIIVFSHSHVAAYSKTAQSKHSTSTGTDENCKICQLNHDATAVLNIGLHNALIYGTAYKQLQVAALSYQSISLVLAATRGPPLFS
jgi:hypothetical protein